MTATASTDNSEPKYTTVLAFNKALETNTIIPNRTSSATLDNEDIGTGDGSKTNFIFANANIIRNSQTLYTGGTTSATATTTLIYSTDYLIDWDLGVAILTAAGITKVSTNHVFAKYSYGKRADSLNYSRLISAEEQIDKDVETVFYDGTAATPDFTIITNELHPGQGYNDRVYQSNVYPINSTTTTLNGAVSADDSTITVVSTDGFPSSGSFAIETNKITYTRKTATTFTGCTNVLAHDDGTTVTSYVIEVALDAEGSSPSWTVQSPNTDYSIEFESGEIKLNNDYAFENSIDHFNPPSRVWDRVRFSYQAGYDSIPEDIVRCVHLIAGVDGFNSQVLNAIQRSTDGFETASVGGSTKWIKETIQKYKCWFIKNLND